MALGIACATNNKQAHVVKTQVVSFPHGALVEFNGKAAGRTPADIILPQDAEGNLTEKAEVLVLPNSKQPELYPQRRVLDPRTRKDRVPNRIMVDMTRGSTNEMKVASTAVTHVESESKKGPRPPVPYANRGKPTQAVGLDRWSPGIY
jgi:hypothetical protein